MSVRKRTWTTRKGEEREAWIIDYFDQRRERHIETFGRKKDYGRCPRGPGWPQTHVLYVPDQSLRAGARVWRRTGALRIQQDTGPRRLA